MKSWLTGFRIAATLVGTIVGAGFATGKEIMQFFGRFGAWGTIGALLAGLVFMGLATKVLVLAHHYQTQSFREFNKVLFGPKLGGLISVLTTLMMIGVTAVMLAGSGALFHEQFGFPTLVGIFLVMILCYVFLQKGLKGVFAVNSIVIPIMVLVVLTLAGLRVPSLSMAQILPLKPDSFSWHFILSALTYVAFNLVTTQAVLVPIGKEVSDLKTLKRGGILGGLLFAVCLLGGHLVLRTLTDANAYAIPMAALAQTIGPTVLILIICLIFGEILTTYVGNIFGLLRQLQTYGKLSELSIVLGLLLMTFTISLFDYGTLIESLYPFFGEFGLVFAIFLIFKKSPG